MAKLLFRLRNVPEDEAQEVRELLEAHEFDYYETKAGNWGISMPGIWLKNDDDLDHAKALLHDYQARRAASARASYEEAKREGRTESQIDMLRQNPLKVALYLAAVSAILYISVKTFFSF